MAQNMVSPDWWNRFISEYGQQYLRRGTWSEFLRGYGGRGRTPQFGQWGASLFPEIESGYFGHIEPRLSEPGYVPPSFAEYMKRFPLEHRRAFTPPGQRGEMPGRFGHLGAGGSRQGSASRWFFR